MLDIPEKAGVQASLKLSAAVQQRLRCPVCRSALELDERELGCANDLCGARFPVVGGVPALINEQNSIFSLDDFTNWKGTFFKPEPRAVRALKRLIPEISRNVKGARNYAELGRRLRERPGGATALVIGGSTLGHGMEQLLSCPRIDLVESDISLGPRTALICDAHDIPFADGSFDAVIVQAVLQHVVDPYRCAAEIHRVLQMGGLVYAETPFMQQVHGGRYDFTRWTHLGHRRLWRAFEEIESGAVCGPGMALAWSYQYFLLSFTRSKPARALIRLFAGLTASFLKYFDSYLVDKSAALDAASGYYFMGQKSDQVLSDRELIKRYRGAIGQVA